MSSAPNTPESRTTARRMSDKSTRSRLGSKLSLRPASCTGWNVTPSARLIEDREEVRMQGRFTAGDLHQVRFALARDQGIEHARDRVEAEVLRFLRRGFGKAHRTGEIAVLVDLDQRQARVLLMVWT